MPKRKKSKKRNIPIPSMIVVLNSETEKKKALKNIADTGSTGFDIQEIDQQGSVPIVRATHHPVHSP